MNQTQAVAQFLTLLDRQTVLVDQLTQYERQLHDAVGGRRFDDLEDLIRRMIAKSEQIADVEEARNQVYQDLALSIGGSHTFARILEALPPDVRHEFSHRYRALKVAVLRLRSRVSSMDAYLRSSIATTRGVLRELYPEHSTSGYSSDGQDRFATAPALVVNQER